MDKKERMLKHNQKTVLNAKNGSVDNNREKIQPKTRNTKNLYNNLLTKKTKQKKKLQY
jgi:hypothetical protein